MNASSTERGKPAWRVWERFWVSEKAEEVIKRNTSVEKKAKGCS
jgi:hypothetical protein